ILSRQVTRRDFLSTSLKAGAATLSTALLPKLKVNAEAQYNVLFIAVDDLRPLLGCYGHSEMHTPNIDRLAKQGTLFNRAYCQFPVCNPSRVSVLTGWRPDTTRIYDNPTDFRKVLPGVVTLPQHFKDHGYHTRSVGKIAHGDAAWKDELSWSEPIWRERWKYINKENSPSWQALNVDDDELEDGKIANAAVEVLTEIKDEQFFLAVGFNKPHLPFYAPRKYFDLYTTQDFKLPVGSSLPRNAPNIASNPKGMRAYQDISNYPPFSEEKTLELTRAYAANVSYIDALVGRVLDQLDVLNLTENTVIAFWGDHGFHLGEHGLWRKNTLFEDSVRSPLIVSMPKQTHTGTTTDALVELIDIYPTLCDACQLPIPTEVEGVSMVPVIEEPARQWKAAAFSQLVRTLNSTSVDGYSMRTGQYRYTEWDNNGEYGRELYDYYADPNETVNIVDFPENEELVSHLSEQLHAGWQAALPEMHGQIRVPQTLPWDINNDGTVDIQDMILVSNSFDVEMLEHPKVDVNEDGRVDIIDLLLVAAHFGESSNPAAPATRAEILPEHLDRVSEWLAEARMVGDGSHVFKQGMTTLERLINTASPRKTALLPNYPNPFNPETWIPYDLARDADVRIHIYNLKGQSIRQLKVGFQTAGTYRTRSRAAYWDGRNAAGEPIASGIYFYTLQAGGFKATRQMVILK
ncbi:MAG: sulfatase-like hydrolase/transferase, partial [Candidatus Poribacteria bacterium]|nr:sulfatase-like hydrolase/transferase [Candidatus Poribacteria bacterium]